jgi:hypothetical protein
MVLFNGRRNAESEGSMSISAMKQALRALERADKISGYANNQMAIYALSQAIAEAEKPAHTDHPSRHWDRTCPACVYESDISQERVDETAKRKHDIVGACVTCGAPHGFWLSAPPTDFISPAVVKAISKREWVGLTEEEIYDYADKFLYQHGSNYGIKSFGKAIEAKLKEKNT